MNNQLNHRIEEDIKIKRRIPVYMLMIIGLFFLALIIYMLFHWEHNLLTQRISLSSHVI